MGKLVFPAKAGIQRGISWTPACAGATSFPRTISETFNAIARTPPPGTDNLLEIKQFQGASLLYRVVEPDHYRPGADYPLVVMIHGYASSMDDMAGLAPHIDRTGYVYACPNAPIDFQVRSGRIAYGWSSPGSSEAEVEAEEVEAADLLEVFFSEVFQRYHAQPGGTLMLGFSQGGNLSLRCGLPRPETFAGLASLSGYLPESEALRDRLPEQRDQSVFVAHGTHDQYIPLTQAQEIRDFLVEEGYDPLYREYPCMRHEVAPPVVSDLAPWIRRVLPPRRA